MDRNRVFEAILALVECNDWDIFHEVAGRLPSELPLSERHLHTLIGTTLLALINDYDYTASPAFVRQVAGKSAAFAEKKAHFESEPVKRRVHRQAFLNALATLLSDDRAFELLDPSRHPSLRAVKDAVLQLRG